jgi:hypothetical protein
MNILLDYFFPIASIDPTPAASTAFLKQALVVVKPKVGATEDTITLCTSTGAIDAFSVTAVEADQLFSAGMSRVYVVAVDDLTGLGDILEGHEADFFTVLISYDFTDTEIDAMDLGEFKGVVGMASHTGAKNTTRAANAQFAPFYTTVANRGKNMFYAFGKLLSNSLSWKNQQYITLAVADDIATLGDAEALFDDNVNFCLSDDQYGNRLALFAVGGKAIVAPYIKRNIEIDMQSAALSYISGNQPAYTHTQAALLEDELQKVLNGYIEDQMIEAGTVQVTLDEDNFVASSSINIAEPKAMWRVFGEIRQTL